ncbi:MAG: type IV secretion protein Rhs [Oxalobacteraceae bacterium]|nr:MAG: type IV secretion protein Rhs [Oxalobacteraceae bacterium]
MPDNMAMYAISKEVNRKLTLGERALANSIFSFGLNLDKVIIHNRPYQPFQSRGVAMTPNGEMWFKAMDFKHDFSTNVLDAAWFLHEMTHVWQFQTGRLVRMRGLLEQIGRLRGSDPYPYGAIDPKRNFSSYKNEQQAALVEDYYRIRHRLKPRYGSGSIEDYERAIPFLPKRIMAQRPVLA